MMNLQSSNTLRQRLAIWSDVHLTEARAFVAVHAGLIPHELTNAQLHGLANIARNAKTFSQVRDFLQHQALKAERAGKLKMQECWQALKAKLDACHDEAVDIARAAGARAQEDWTHRRLAQLFIQHLIAESAVQAKANERFKSERG